MHQFAGKPRILKEVNSSMIEQLIYGQGPISKPALAKLTGLSLPTVNKLVDDLERQGCIRSVGLAGKGAGRKAMQYEINKNSGCLIALYYQWGHYVGRISDITGQTLQEELFPLDNETAQAAESSTLSAIDALMRHAPSEVKMIGIGIPGVVMPDGRLLGIPKISVWEGFNLAQMLERRYGVSICVENDVKLSAVGYYHAHLSDQKDHIVYFYAGNGLGSGIIINRKLYRGATNFSGELGFMAPLLGTQPIADYTAKGGYLEAQLGKHVNYAQGEVWEKNDPKQREVLASILAAAASNYVAVLNPDVIVFGGEAFDEDLIAEIHQQMAYYTPKESMPKITHDFSRIMGIEGLVLTCRGGINTWMQFVESGGV